MGGLRGHLRGWPLLAAACLLAVGALALLVWHRAPTRTLRVGYWSFPPYLIVKPDGSPDGFAVAVFSEAARRRQTPIEWVNAKGSPDKAFAAGTIDLYPMLAITDARRTTLALSPPWWENNLGLFTRRGQTVDRAALARGAVRVSLVDLSFGAPFFKRAFPHATIVPFLDHTPVAEAVCTGRADAGMGEARIFGLIRDNVPACRDVALEFRWYRELNLTYAVGAQRPLQREADAFQREIMALALDGTMTGIGEKWGVQATNQMMLFRDLVAVRDRNLLLALAVLSLTALVALALWQYRKVQRAHVAAEQASLAKNQFLANVSHEIRTPLNGILGMTELLLGTPLVRTQREFVEALDESGRALLAIISDILDFSKIEAGKLTLDDQDVDIRQLVEQVVLLFAARASEKGLDVGARIAADVPLVVRGDAGRLRQVLSNLTGNAVKFTDTGSVFVRVERPSDPTPGLVRLRFTIEDTGIGVPEPLRERLFKPFSQIDGSARRRHGGTGLGLAISRQLVRMMNGDIGIESRAEGGSAFWFETAMRVESPAVPAPPAEAMAGLPVLVVSSLPLTSRLVAAHVEEWGARITSASDVSEAMARLAHAPARTLVIIDESRLYAAAHAQREAFRLHLAERRSPVVTLLPVSNPTAAKGEAVGDPLIPGSLAIALPVRADALRTAAIDALQQTPRAEDLARARALPERLAARVLVADDNTINQKVVLSLLRRLGCQAVVVSNGRDALEAARRSLSTAIDDEPLPTPFDLVLMDCQMPEMDGLEATRAIRRLGGGDTLPIIALTATSLPEQWTECEAAGMNGFLTKPCGLEALRAEIFRWAPQTRVTEDVA
jgi:signal transduction histidine kinase/FixJ family two-component response regulator